MILGGVGIGLSHYSTMYVFVGTLAVAWVRQNGLMAASGTGTGRTRPKPKPAGGAGWADATRSVGLVASWHSPG